jgi:hypothetical protein
LLKTEKESLYRNRTFSWQRLDELGIVPGTSLYFQGKRVRKTRPVTGFGLACKWRRNSGKYQVKEAWFILTDLRSLPAAINAYKQRMALKKCFETVKKEAMILKNKPQREPTY